MRCSSLIVIAALAGCAGATAPTAQTIAGTYQLKTVNGVALPYSSFRSSSESDDVVSGTIQLNSNGTYFDGALFSVLRSGTPSFDRTDGGGTYTRNGDRISFTEGPETYSATLSGNILTFTDCLPAVMCPDAGLTAVYVK